jgi:ABC-2 type transport system permease protein
MSKVLKVAKREYQASVRTKGFLIGLLLAPILMSGGIIAMVLFEDHVDTTDQRIAVIDRSGVVAEGLARAAEERNQAVVYDPETGEKVKPAYFIEIHEPNDEDPVKQRLELSERVRDETLRAFVEIGPEVLHPSRVLEERTVEVAGTGGTDAAPSESANHELAAARISYHAERAALDEVRGWLGWPINLQLRSARLREAGVDAESIDDLFSWLNIEAMGLVHVDENGEVQEAQKVDEGEAIGAPMVMMMLMFIMVLMGAMPLLSSVMEEKTQRIAEVLLGSIQPFDFMMGKVLGGIAVSLTASAVYVIGGIIVFRTMDLEHYVPYHVIPWFFAFMVLNILMLGSMMAALGSACSDPKDAQSLSLPAMFPVMIPMFMLGPILQQPTSALATTFSLIPPFTPLLMVLRQSMPGAVPAWQPWAGLFGVLVVSLLTVWAGGRIFRVGILMQGKTPKLPELLRWVVRG